jgi:hypothetical protein
MDELGRYSPAGTAQISPQRETPWRPLLSGELAGQARQVAGRLAAGLGRPGAAAPGHAALSGGSAGLAVCHAVLARLDSDPQAAAQAFACLDDAAGWLASGHVPASLYAGFTGVAWAAEVVDALLAAGTGDRNEGIDAALAAILQRPLAGPVPYDLINGLTGLGVYALARWPRRAGAECLAAVIGQLGRQARRDSDGVYWRTPPALLLGPQRQRHPGGGVDLGVAHGVAGVLPLLARAQALGVARELAGPLLGGAVRWLLAHLAETESGQTVPGFLAAGTEPGPARSAWCYGDPGVAMALLLAARDAGEAGWAEIATGLAVRAAARPPEQTGVVDAGLCHGTAGLAHLFNRMHQLTGEAALARAAEQWIQRTLSLCAAAEAGTAEPGPAQPPWNGPGLLEGAAGVLLALLAASTAMEPVWDQMLLVSAGGPAAVSPA